MRRIATSVIANRLSVNGGVGIGTTYASYFSSPNNGMIVEGNVGIGTASPQTGLAVMGNVGIGTWTTAAALDTSGFRLSTSPSAGYVLVSGSTGIGTWMPATTLPSSVAASGWSTGTGTVYNSTGSDNIGIGTSTPQGGLVVTNGNVGIGTWRAVNVLDVKGGVGVGTIFAGIIPHQAMA